jgi:cytochrome bd-type quinol oxidase subunit 2
MKTPFIAPMKTPNMPVYYILLGILLLVVGGMFALDSFLAYDPILGVEPSVTFLVIGAALIVFGLSMNATKKNKTTDDTATGFRKRNSKVAIVSGVLVVLFIVASFVFDDSFAQSTFLSYFRAFAIVAAIATVVCAYAGMKAGSIVAIVGFLVVAVVATMGFGDLSNSEYDYIENGLRLTEAEEHASAFSMMSLGIAAVQYLGFLVFSSIIIWLAAPKTSNTKAVTRT